MHSMHPMQMIKLVFNSNGLISCLVSRTWSPCNEFLGEFIKRIIARNSLAGVMRNSSEWVSRNSSDLVMRNSLEWVTRNSSELLSTFSRDFPVKDS